MPFPNFSGKHEHDAIFSATRFLEYRMKIGPYRRIEPPDGIILCYSKSLQRYFQATYRVRKVRLPNKIDGFLLLGTKARIMVVANFGIGAPAACAALEECIAIGTKRYITIGAAGSLQKNLHVGDVVVCSKAIRDEGSSYHYLKASKYANPSTELTHRMTSMLKKQRVAFHFGPSWTIDTPYRETVKEARHYQKEGVMTVEMEASALFAVAKYHHVQCAAMFAISDSLAGLEWKPQFHVQKGKRGLEKTFRAAVAALQK